MSNQNNTHCIFSSSRQVVETANHSGSRVERISSLTKQDVKSYIRFGLKPYTLLYHVQAPIISFITDHLRGEVQIQEFLYTRGVTP